MYNGGQDRKVEQILKTRPSPDRGLQFSLVKLESLVMAYHHDAVNTFPGLVHTARQALKVGSARSPVYGVTVKFMIGAKS